MIIGLTGSFGAGKGAVVDYLVNEKGFKHYSARSLILEEVEKQGLSVNRDTLIAVGNKLRKKNGPDYIARTLFNKAKKIRVNAVVESLRATAEVLYIKKNGGIVIGVDAHPKLRYERMVKRGTETDDVSYEKWNKQQEKETNPNDPTKQDIFGALKESNYILMNNGTKEELFQKIEEVLKKLEVIC